MPGGIRINKVVVKRWNKNVPVRSCSFERGPSCRPGVNIGDGKYYLETFDGWNTLTVYTLPDGLQRIIQFALDEGRRQGRNEIKGKISDLVKLLT